MAIEWCPARKTTMTSFLSFWTIRSLGGSVSLMILLFKIGSTRTDEWPFVREKYESVPEKIGHRVLRSAVSLDIKGSNDCRCNFRRRTYLDR